MNSICVIGVYFGSLKNYFSLYLKSCEFNQRIDFLIFTDQFFWGGGLPKNVKIINLNLLTLKELVVKNTGIENISLEHPYRCCDLKPLYGIIFRDYIKQYEYWGHCDFDMIFGDIYSFMEEYNYRKFDKFLNLGHLSFYKNTDKVNNYYKLSGSQYPYMDVLTTNKNFAFDENAGINSILLKHGLSFFIERVFFDISDIYHRFRLSEFCSLTSKDVNYKQQIFCWKDGKVFRYYEERGKLKKEERMYIHFKKRPDFPVTFDVRKANSFFICPLGFVSFNRDITICDIKRYNSYNVIRELCEYSKYKYSKYKNALIRRIKAIL